jgi:DNA-3-methyladenine glycosylase I
LEYHDREWGVPLHADRTHYEFLVLDGFQAGLNWEMILRKRENFRLAFLKIQDKYGSFDAYIWTFVEGRTRHNAWRSLQEIPATTTESETMSKDLHKRDFSFVGPTICYAYMQAAGLVNDHTIDCFRYAELKSLTG